MSLWSCVHLQISSSRIVPYNSLSPLPQIWQTLVFFYRMKSSERAWGATRIICSFCCCILIPLSGTSPSPSPIELDGHQSRFRNHQEKKIQTPNYPKTPQDSRWKIWVSVLTRIIKSYQRRSSRAPRHDSRAKMDLLSRSIRNRFFVLVCYLKHCVFFSFLFQKDSGTEIVSRCCLLFLLKASWSVRAYGWIDQCHTFRANFSHDRASLIWQKRPR